MERKRIQQRFSFLTLFFSFPFFLLDCHLQYIVAVKRIMQEARELVREPSTDFAANPLEVSTACCFCSLTHGDGRCSNYYYFAFGRHIVDRQHIVQKGEFLRKGEYESTARMTLCSLTYNPFDTNIYNLLIRMAFLPHLVSTK